MESMDVRNAGVNIFTHKRTSVREEFPKIGHLGKSFGWREALCRQNLFPIPQLFLEIVGGFGCEYKCSSEHFSKNKRRKILISSHILAWKWAKTAVALKHKLYTMGEVTFLLKFAEK